MPHNKLLRFKFKQVFLTGVLLLAALPQVILAQAATDDPGDGVYERKGFDYYYETMRDNTRLGGYDDIANEGPILTAARVVNLLLGLLGTVALSMTVYAGFLWLTARGNEEHITKAKDILQGSVAGVLVVLASFSFMAYVFRSFVNITD